MIVGTIVLAVAFFMIFKIRQKLAIRDEIKAKIQSLPVHAKILTLDGARFSFPVNKPTLLLLYNSNCEHCQHELVHIKAAINSFSNIELVFLSSEPSSAIKQSALLFEGNQNVNFVKINPEDVYDNFGTVRYPTILIYGANGKLAKEFKGETKVEAILKYVRQ